MRGIPSLQFLYLYLTTSDLICLSNNTYQQLPNTYLCMYVDIALGISVKIEKLFRTESIRLMQIILGWIDLRESKSLLKIQIKLENLIVDHWNVDKNPPQTIIYLGTGGAVYCTPLETYQQSYYCLKK